MADTADYGITVTEIAAMDQPMSVTAETSAAFVGRTLRGPVDRPIRVESFVEFKRRFGGLWNRSGLPEAARQFFEHGGRDLIVVRVTNSARGSMLCLPADGCALVLRAVEPGSTELLRAAVDYDRIDDDEHFNLTLQRVDPETGLVIDQELHAAASFREESTAFIGDALARSALARLEKPFPAHRPEATGLDYVEAVEKGKDGEALSDYDIVGSRTDGTGLFALTDIDHFDLLYVPKTVAPAGPTAILAAERYARERGAILLADPLPDWDDTDASLKGLRELGFASPNMLTYFPLARCSESGHREQIGGALAGLLSRNDRERGAWHPVDSVHMSVRLKPDITLTDDDVLKLNRAGVNALCANERKRTVLFGDRMLSRGSEAHIAFNSLSVRRTVLNILNAVDHATRWAVFEHLSESHADRLCGQIETYLACLADLEALSEEALHVDCAPMHGTGVSVDLRFIPQGMTEALSLTLHQSVGGLKVAGTAFGKPA